MPSLYFLIKYFNFFFFNLNCFLLSIFWVGFFEFRIYAIEYLVHSVLFDLIKN